MWIPSHPAPEYCPTPHVARHMFIFTSICNFMAGFNNSIQFSQNFQIVTFEFQNCLASLNYNFFGGK